jgi:hypothetical protein
MSTPADTSPAVPASAAAQTDTPAAASDVRDELNAMFDIWQKVTRLEPDAKRRVGSWLKDHLSL